MTNRSFISTVQAICINIVSVLFLILVLKDLIGIFIFIVYLKCDLFFQKVLCILKRVHILQWLDEMFYSCVSITMCSMIQVNIIDSLLNYLSG